MNNLFNTQISLYFDKSNQILHVDSIQSGRVARVFVCVLKLSGQVRSGG